MHTSACTSHAIDSSAFFSMKSCTSNHPFSSVLCIHTICNQTTEKQLVCEFCQMYIAVAHLALVFYTISYVSPSAGGICRMQNVLWVSSNIDENQPVHQFSFVENHVNLLMQTFQCVSSDFISANNKTKLVLCSPCKCTKILFRRYMLMFRSLWIVDAVY